MSELVHIDGSVLEGGGQILRLSISLSAILGVPVRVFNIRSKRSKPGLAAQHLKGVLLVAQMCQARLKGDNIGSTEVEFYPGKINGGIYRADTHTAGSISLLMQVALPVALFAESRVTLELRGGSNTDMAPQIDYMMYVFRPLLKKFNADFQLNIHRRGYYPRGGGKVTVDINPVRELSSVTLMERGEIQRVRGLSFVSGVLPLRVAEEMADGAKEHIYSIFNKIDILSIKEDRALAPDTSCGIIVWAELSGGGVLGSDALGRRGVDPRDLGRAAGAHLKLALHAGVTVDHHAQDQALVYMALAGGRSSLRAGDVSLHTRTAAHVAELLANVKFDIEPDGEHNIIACTGLGLVNDTLGPDSTTH